MLRNCCDISTARHNLLPTRWLLRSQIYLSSGLPNAGRGAGVRLKGNAISAKPSHDTAFFAGTPAKKLSASFPADRAL